MARQQPSSSLFVVVLGASIVLACACTYGRLPGGLVLALGFLLAVIVEPHLPEDHPDAKWKRYATRALVPSVAWVDVRRVSVLVTCGLSLVVASLRLHNTLVPEYGALTSWWWVNALAMFHAGCWISGLIREYRGFSVSITRLWHLLPLALTALLVSVGAFIMFPDRYGELSRLGLWVVGCGLIASGALAWVMNVSRAREKYARKVEQEKRWEYAASVVGNKTHVPSVCETFTWCGVEVSLLKVDPLTQNMGWIKATPTIQTALGLPGTLVLLTAPALTPDGSISWETPSRDRLYALLLPPKFTLDPAQWDAEDPRSMFLGASLALACGVDGYMSAHGGGKIDPTKRLYPSRIQPLHRQEAREETVSWWAGLKSRLQAWGKSLRVARIRDTGEDTSTEGSEDLYAPVTDFYARATPRLKDLLVRREYSDPWGGEGLREEASSSLDEEVAEHSHSSSLAIFSVDVVPDTSSTSSFHDLTFYEEYMGLPVIVDDIITTSLYIGEGVIDPGCPYARRLVEVFGTENIRDQLDERVSQTRAWETRWRNVKAVSSVPPTPQWATLRDESFGEVRLTTLGFVTRNGVAPAQFFRGCEAELAASMNAIPTLAVVGYPAPGKSQGSRHSQAIRVIYSDTPLPPDVATWRSDTLTPPARSGVFLAMQVLVARAFAEAKLPRCEVEKVRALARLDSPRQTWIVDLVLYDGVSVGDVRAKLAKISNVFATSWVSIHASSPGRMTLIVGAQLSQITLARRGDHTYVTNALWQHTFTACRLSSPLSGQMPEIVSTEPLESNEQITRTVFRLPAGLSRENMEGKTEALATSAGLAFLSWESDKSDARNLVALSSPVNPLPDLAPYDFAWQDDHTGIVGLGVGVDGRVLAWDPLLDPHLLLVGTSGSGKSAATQGLIYGCLANGWDVIVADPNKRGVDFQPFHPWLSAVVTQPQREGGRAWVAAMLEAVYSEVERRVALNATWSASSFMEIPEDERPRRLVVVLDEFNSLIKAPKPTRPSGNDPTIMNAYAHALADYENVARIGKYAADIAAQARSAGVSLVLIGQQLKASDLDAVPDANGLRTNLSRILLGNSTYGDKQGALRSPENAPRLGEHIPKGRGLFEPTSQSRASLIQFYYAHPPKEAYPRELSLRRKVGSQTLYTFDVTEEMTNPVVEGQIVSDVVDHGVLDIDFGDFTLADENDVITEPDLSFADNKDSSQNTDDGRLELGAGVNNTRVPHRRDDPEWDDLLDELWA